MPYNIPAKRFGGPKGRAWTNRAIAKTRLAKRRTMLLPSSGGDHITTAKGGGIDLMGVRARLTQFTTWTLTASQQILIPRRPDAALEWTTYAAIYDQFKVNGIKVTYAFPKYMVANTASVTGVLAQELLSYPELVVFAYDNDSIAAAASFAATVGYSTAKVSSCDGLVSYNLPTLPKGATYGASALGYINSSVWQDVATPASLAGVITAWVNKATGTNSGSAYAINVVVEWDVSFKGKRN